MNDFDSESRPSTPQLEYRSVEDDRKPGEAWKVLAFMGGMVVGILVSAFIGGVCAAGLIESRSSPGHAIAILIGLGFVGFGVWAIVLSVKVTRQRPTDAAFLLGFLCGACIACLLEGSCFTLVGLSS